MTERIEIYDDVVVMKIGLTDEDGREIPRGSKATIVDSIGPNDLVFEVTQANERLVGEVEFSVGFAPREAFMRVSDLKELATEVLLADQNVVRQVNASVQEAVRSGSVGDVAADFWVTPQAGLWNQEWSLVDDCDLDPPSGSGPTGFALAA